MLLSRSSPRTCTQGMRLKTSGRTKSWPTRTRSDSRSSSRHFTGTNGAIRADFALPIALLPPLEPVTRRACLLILRCLRNFAALMSAQLPMKGIQHFGDMIVELPAKGRGSSSTPSHSLQPCASDAGSTRGFSGGGQRAHRAAPRHLVCASSTASQAVQRLWSEIRTVLDAGGSSARNDTLPRQTKLGVSPQRDCSLSCPSREPVFGPFGP